MYAMMPSGRNAVELAETEFALGTGTIIHGVHRFRGRHHTIQLFIHYQRYRIHSLNIPYMQPIALGCRFVPVPSAGNFSIFQTWSCSVSSPLFKKHKCSLKSPARTCDKTSHAKRAERFIELRSIIIYSAVRLWRHCNKADRRRT